MREQGNLIMIRFNLLRIVIRSKSRSRCRTRPPAVVGTPKNAAERSALRCRNANTVSRHNHMPAMSSARNDGLAADVIGDVGEIDAGQLALLAGEPRPS